MTMASLLHSGDKDLKEIQWIVTFTKPTNLGKGVIEVIVDLAMIAKKK